jgi:predicted RecA/RadA family phage recombinase
MSQLGDSPADVIQVTLDDAMFAECVQRYIDEDKPDALQQKQMESWVWHWENKSTVSNITANSMASFTPTHIMSGALSIQGEYIAVTLTSECSWIGDGDDGSLFFSCHASAQSIAETPRTNESSSETNATAPGSSLSPKEQKQQAKIRRKMLTRLQDDDYIKKILNANGTSNESLELCQATIHIAQATSDSNLQSQLEERVHCNQDVAEAIRRAIFSTAEAPLDVFDLVCRCAILPSTSLASIVPHTTPLADRAKLRILEDATYDACENEEEEEIVQDLNIERRTEVDAEQSSKKKKSKR